MRDVGSSVGVKNISDLVLKEIYGICETKNPTKELVDEYKMTKREIYKKFTNLSKKSKYKKTKMLMLEMSWLLLWSDVEEKKQELWT